MLYTTEQSNANTIATEQKELRTIRKWKDLLKKKHPQIDGNKSGKKRPRKNRPKVRTSQVRKDQERTGLRSERDYGNYVLSQKTEVVKY